MESKSPMHLIFLIQVLEFAEKRYKQKMNAHPPDSQLDSIGCLPMTIPFILLSASDDEEKAVSTSTRNSILLERCQLFVGSFISSDDEKGMGVFYPSSCVPNKA